MDTIPDRSKKKNVSELILEKPSPDSIGGAVHSADSYVANGETIQVAPDLKGLQEFDWHASEVQGWIQSEDFRLKEKFSGLINEDLDQLLALRKTILDRSPDLSTLEASEIALQKLREQRPRKS